MKGAIINSLLQPFTPSKKPSRLHIITGKGGVGKTTVSMCTALAHHKKGFNVKYLCFDDKQSSKLINDLKLPVLELSLDKSVPIYLERKFKSKRVANWISSTQFFKSIFNVLPSLGNMVYLGHLVDMLETDPSLHVVVDSPSSGHAMALFQSMDLWYNIFGQGLLAKDITRMKNFFAGENNFSISVVSLVTEMSLQESNELVLQIKKSQPHYSVERIINNILMLNPIVKEYELPDFLAKKVKMEETLLKQVDYSFQSLAHFSEQTMSSVVNSVMAAYDS